MGSKDPSDLKLDSVPANQEHLFEIPPKTYEIELEFNNTSKETNLIWSGGSVVSPAIQGGEPNWLIFNYKWLPNEVMKRYQLGLSAKSVVERKVFYQDGMALFWQNPVFGWGGGAWPLLYASEQSYLYFTTQPHNYYLQVAIETGFVGLTLLILMLWFAIVMFLKARAILVQRDLETAAWLAGGMMVVVILAVHGAVDFDLSLSSVFLLFCAGLGIVQVAFWKASAYDNQNPQASFLKKCCTRVLTLSLSVPRWLIGLFTMMVFFGVLSFYDGAMRFQAAEQLLQQGQIDASIDAAKQAMRVDFLHAKYPALFTSLSIQRYFQSEEKRVIGPDEIVAMTRALDQAKTLGWYQVDVLSSVAQMYIAMGKNEEALRCYKQIAWLRPRRIAEWEVLFEAYERMANQLVQDNAKDASPETRSPQERSKEADLPPGSQARQDLQIVLKSANDSLAELNKKAGTGLAAMLPTEKLLGLIEHLEFLQHVPLKQTFLEDVALFYGPDPMDLNRDKRSDAFEWNHLHKQPFIGLTRPILLEPNTDYTVWIQTLNALDASSAESLGVSWLPEAKVNWQDNVAQDPGLLDTKLIKQPIFVRDTSWFPSEYGQFCYQANITSPSLNKNPSPQAAVDGQLPDAEQTDNQNQPRTRAQLVLFAGQGKEVNPITIAILKSRPEPGVLSK
jgi:tetratricopeptide (TPR) repeat protein